MRDHRGPRRMRDQEPPSPGHFSTEDLLQYMSPAPKVVSVSEQVSYHIISRWIRKREVSYGFTGCGMIEQAPTGFESIAATFDFRHHVGTDPALELNVSITTTLHIHITCGSNMQPSFDTTILYNSHVIRC